jgi:hypothetical protein
VYKCGVGYTIEGDTNLECRDDGTWNVQPPSCGKILLLYLVY